MSTSIVGRNLLILNGKGMRGRSSSGSGSSSSSSSNICSCSWWNMGHRERRVGWWVPHAKKKKKKKNWWNMFLFDNNDGNWFGLKEDDMFEDEVDVDVEAEDASKFEAWKSRAEAIVELRESQEDVINQESRNWEDWLVDGSSAPPGDTDLPHRGLGLGSLSGSGSGSLPSLRELLLLRQSAADDDNDHDDLLYEDRVFRYASSNSAKFLGVLIIIPWALDFVVHDYVLMPFLDRYVKTVPLAAEIFDVRRHQKLEMVKELKTEKARFQLEVEIGKSPSLSDDEIWLELRHKALAMREEWRLENRRAFANIWSDTIFGFTLFILLYFNQSKVALLKFTGYKIINNISDAGKAFLIILITDIFLGYHSESGWQTLLEIMVDHYGLNVDRSAITIFVCIVPVVVDSCAKLWLFKYLPRLSPRVGSILQEMKRH